MVLLASVSVGAAIGIGIGGIIVGFVGAVLILHNNEKQAADVNTAIDKAKEIKL